MREALLISNSTSHGSGYLDHCEGEMLEFLGRTDEVLFIPYAIPDMDRYSEKAVSRLEKMVGSAFSIHDSTDPREAIMRSEAVFIGGGNTFLLLKRLYDNDLVGLIRERVLSGMKYIGTSAGSNVACKTINTTNDMPIVQPPSFDAIGIVPFILNPHYIDPEAGSTHKGETRKQRIDQYHEIDGLPVIGLRESALLLIRGDEMELRGPTGARSFQRNQEPVDHGPGSDLSFFLKD
jgi:dipeptidase E